MALTALAVAILLVRALTASAAREAVVARRAALRGELDRLVAAQAALFAREGRIATSLADSALAYVPADSLLLRYDRLDAVSWQAVVHDPLLPGSPSRCGVYEGDSRAAPHRAVVEPAVVACW